MLLKIEKTSLYRIVEEKIFAEKTKKSALYISERVFYKKKLTQGGRNAFLRIISEGLFIKHN